jgi:hypothetical protein
MLSIDSNGAISFVSSGAPIPAPSPSVELSTDAAAGSYQGAKSGTLECSGEPIPQNAEYVFRNVPPVQLRLEYNKKIWEGKLVPGDGQTQVLILKNIGNGPQKKCVVHWTVIEQ